MVMYESLHGHLLTKVVKMKLVFSILLVLISLNLSACATEPTTDYSLSASEMKNAGSASIDQHENLEKLYANAPFVDKSSLGNKKVR